MLNVGDSSCLTPGNLLSGSFGSLDPSTLVPSQLSQEELLKELPLNWLARSSQILGQGQTGKEQLMSAATTRSPRPRTRSARAA